LIELGLRDRLLPHVVAPTALRVLNARTGREIVRMPLGRLAEQRYGAPYWSIHRGDLQAALSAAVNANIDIALKLGMRVEDFAAYHNGVTVSARSRAGAWDERGFALIGADGLWSRTRERIGYGGAPTFSGRTAWRAVVPAGKVAPEFREPMLHLWLSRQAHLVHYPVKAGAAINIVVIMADSWNAPGWSEPASRNDLLSRIAGAGWTPQALALVNAPEAWLKWALYERRRIGSWSKESVGLVGDAAHPMLPFLAQGAAMAIEDAAVVTQCLARMPDDPEKALHTYWAVRQARATKVQRLATRNGDVYHFAGLRAAARNTAMRLMGGTGLLRHYDWLYDWRPPAGLSMS
jgi:salicylate hydroxylase